MFAGFDARHQVHPVLIVRYVLGQMLAWPNATLSRLELLAHVVCVEKVVDLLVHVVLLREEWVVAAYLYWLATIRLLVMARQVRRFQRKQLEALGAVWGRALHDPRKLVWVLQTVPKQARVVLHVERVDGVAARIVVQTVQVRPTVDNSNLGVPT